MNSVIAGLEFIAPASLDVMTRGQMCLLSSTGNIVTVATDIKEEHMYQFIVALGDNKYKRGVWINPKKANAYYEAYKAPAQKVITLSNITTNTGDMYVGGEVAVVITLPLLNNFYGEYVKVVTATTDIIPGDTDASVKERLKKVLDKKVSEINAEYGVNTIVLNPIAGTTIGTTLTITGKAGLKFDAHLEGFIMGSKTDNGAIVTPVGTSKQILNLEKNEDVANAGYNPNFDLADNPYGNIFTGDLADSYNIFTINSRADRTHQFDINTLGMEVVQWIAIDTAASATLLTAMITALGGGTINEY